MNSKDQVQTTNKNDILLPEITDNDNNNFNKISSNQNNEAKKEYDVWPEIGLFTYIVFLVNIIYIITLIIYFKTTLDGETFEKCDDFVIFSGIFESIYIVFSFFIFCCNDKIAILNYYMHFVITSAIFTFAFSLDDFTDTQYFTTTCKVIVISGSSLIMLLSLIYYIWACKLIYFNKHVKIVLL